MVTNATGRDWPLPCPYPSSVGAKHRLFARGRPIVKKKNKGGQGFRKRL